MPTLWIAGAIITVMVVRRFSRLVGALLGLVVSAVMAGWGYWVFHHGGAMAFAGVQLSPSIFYVLVAFWAALECFEIVRHARRRQPPPPSAPPPDDE
ncbi:MAG: hypothetical protein HY903_07365 [Deltaproteobacteria bacterium]|nr:hypothetical protein [Deltaproteobacteria bacterium]